LTRLRRNALPSLQKITPCLWFDHPAEEAAEFYTAILAHVAFASHEK
jgi:predicted 3-demethylubiquinone-9 3-methyltransferase (glyoxalase superfamily)